MTFLYDLFGTPFGWVMKFIYNIVKDYGVAIILFTLFTKILLFPIGYKQQKNTAKMQLLNPKLVKLKKSFANNPQRLQEEQMKLYQEENVNPMSSCLPMLLQFVLLFGVLDVVYKPLTHIIKISKDTISKAKDIIIANSDALGGITFSKGDLRQELKIMDAVSKDGSLFNSLDGLTDKIQGFNSKIFGVLDLSKTPQLHPDNWNAEAVMLFMIPILAGVVQLIFTFYTQYKSRQQNPDMPGMGAMSIMLYVMPLFSIWFAFQVPAGVGFYWILSSLFSFVQTFALYAYFTPERAEAIFAKDKEKAKLKNKNGKKSFMTKMMEQQQEALAQQQAAANGTPVKRKDPTTDGMSKSEMNVYNRQKIKEARRRMAEKYGEEYDDDDID